MFAKLLHSTCLLILAFGLVCCQKELEPFTTAQQPTEPKPGEFMKFTIPAGQHNATYNPLTPVSYEELKFVVKFDSTAIYTNADTANQRDVNKLYGFADNNDHHNNFSARFGWRWKDNELHLFAYRYNNAVRTIDDLGKVDIGKEHNCSIRVAGNQYIFTLNGVQTQWPRASTTPKSVGYKLFPFFGGDEVAPHTIYIWIKEL